MAKVKIPYKTENIIDRLVLERQGKYRIEQARDMSKKDIFEDMEKYTGIGWESIKRISGGRAQPSLPVAMKIAEYFQKSVDDIFNLVDEKGEKDP
ncbi:helix-turn-helix domain-containing protein [Priestia megaterium]|uniref:helix-turn-helix domain-containing protein n=1 Tax=Priestia megaterium TaxID=1404 RepID=UPI000BFE0F70|nr:helix-turn-helix domain-containing protein [Priestia megaterium]PGO60628.1 hypothetical protein CN981_08750 [Priestia megaterium]